MFQRKKDGRARLNDDKICIFGCTINQNHLRLPNTDADLYIPRHVMMWMYFCGAAHFLRDKPEQPLVAKQMYAFLRLVYFLSQQPLIFISRGRASKQSKQHQAKIKASIITQMHKWYLRWQTQIWCRARRNLPNAGCVRGGGGGPAKTHSIMKSIVALHQHGYDLQRSPSLQMKRTHYTHCSIMIIKTLSEPHSLPLESNRAVLGKWCY